MQRCRAAIIYRTRAQLRERVQMEGDDVIYYYYETGWKMVYFIQLHLLALSLSLSPKFQYWNCIRLKMPAIFILFPPCLILEKSNESLELWSKKVSYLSFYIILSIFDWWSSKKVRKKKNCCFFFPVSFSHVSSFFSPIFIARKALVVLVLLGSAQWLTSFKNWLLFWPTKSRVDHI